MKQKIVNILKFILFLSIGLILLWLVYRDIPKEQIIKSLKDFDYFWVWTALIASISSHISRAMRWRLLILPLGYKPRMYNTFFAVMIMYLINLTIPRMGEVSRCGLMKKYENIPFSKLLGTVLIERMVDTILLVFLFFVVVVTQFDTVLNFVNNNPEIEANFNKLLNLKTIAVAIFAIGLVVGIIYFAIRNKIKSTTLYKKTIEKIKGFKEGFITIKNMENKWAFIAHSLFIYVMYFAMIYLCFFGYEATKNLSPMAGLSVFVLASFGMVAPVSGGFGAWHFMAIETLFIFGVPREPEGAAFAFVTHGAMTLMLIVGGFISLILIPVFNKKQHKKELD